ncbi:hypothetical protein FRC07_001022, partial [Ceratobasidium sp. 392]
SELSSAPPSRPSSPAPIPAPSPEVKTPSARRKKSAPKATPLPKATSSLPKSTPAPKATPAPFPKKRTYQQRKRQLAPPSEETPASSEEDNDTATEPPRRKPPRKRRAAPQQPDSGAPTAATPKRGKKPRASIGTAATPSSLKPPAISALQQQTRPPSFLTKATIPVALPSTLVNNKPRADVWNYSELDGLVWVRLDVGAGETTIAGVEQSGGRMCWWPGEVTQRTPNALKLTLCGAPPNGTTSLELLPSSLSESNILTFRRVSGSTVRFPAFKNAYISTEPSISSTEPSTSANPSTSSAHLSIEKLEQLWKSACARAFEIDTESNDGLEDICLLFSQKTRSTRDDSTQGSAEHVEVIDQEDDGYGTDDCDLIETDTVVLCRYRTRFYPAKVCVYYPRGERGHCGKYLCKFADDSTRIATRKEIHTQLDPGFATCPLGDYQKWESDSPPEGWAGRPPTPEPRASSPEPESDSTIDTTEYCARERMRDQLRPLLSFLQGIISRTYVPCRGGKEEDVLDRHGAYMQGGRARKSLAYSVHTGDLNEDDCEALMYEISRWALRGERWAGRVGKVEGVGLEVEDVGEVAMVDTEGAAPVDTESGATAGVSTPMDTVDVAATATPVDPTDVIDITSTSASQVSLPLAEEVKDTPMAEDSDPASVDVPATEAEPQTSGDLEMKDVEDDAKLPASLGVVEPREVEQAGHDTPETGSEDEGDKTIVPDNTLILDGDSFHELIKRQPSRPVGSDEYEQLTPAERLGYISDVLYPEAAALILSYRRGIRTHVGPVSDPQAELELYTAGIQAAKNTPSPEDWVDKILATRQLREAAVLKNGPSEVEQVVVPGGTRSRPKYMLNKTMSVLK